MSISILITEENSRQRFEELERRGAQGSCVTMIDVQWTAAKDRIAHRRTQYSAHFHFIEKMWTTYKVNWNSWADFFILCVMMNFVIDFIREAGLYRDSCNICFFFSFSTVDCFTYELKTSQKDTFVIACSRLLKKLGLLWRATIANKRNFLWDLRPDGFLENQRLISTIKF